LARISGVNQNVYQSVPIKATVYTDGPSADGEPIVQTTADGHEPLFSQHSSGYINTVNNEFAKSNIDNIDQREIDKFSELASRWWDEESEFKPLHDINPIRLNYIQQHAQLAGKQVVDVGCGGGILSESMARAGAAVTGIDLAQAAIDIARLHAAETQVKVDYQCTSTEDFSNDFAGRFDIVTCMEMLEHVPEPEAIVESCCKMLKPGGSAFFSTLNRNGKSWLYAIVGAEYVLQLLPRGTHQWNRFIKPSELASWCRQADLYVNDLTGMTYNPLTKVYRADKDISVNYLLHSTRSE